MEIVNRELRRHTLMLADAKRLVYNSKHHHKGVDAYTDKKKIHDLEIKIRDKGQLMTINVLQFLETIHEKY
jgi:hypothetical protein